MSKIEIERGCGIKSEEATNLLLKILREEGFDERDFLGFCGFVPDDIQEKITIHEKHIFEEKLKEIIKERKEELCNNYFEAHKEIHKAFS